ncbi:MAG: hypothetical protein WKG03_02360 [Telluria sp.]
MDSLRALNERINFADRLHLALVAAQQPTSPTAFTRAYNLRADGAAVSPHGARKWLRGEAVPTQEKILALARWLNVHAAWLRFGDPENGTYGPAGMEMLPTEHRILIQDVMSLSLPLQEIIRDFVDTMLKLGAISHDARIESSLRSR